jgi:hypothetical protein
MDWLFSAAPITALMSACLIGLPSSSQVSSIVMPPGAVDMPFTFAEFSFILSTSIPDPKTVWTELIGKPFGTHKI